jgi:ribokinase
LLTGVKPASEDSMQQCCNRLHDKGIGKVILTLGAKGAFLSDRESGLYNLVPGFIVDAVDTTAAGDVFNGALAVAISEGINIQEGIRFAHAAAALSAGKTGAQPSIPFRGEIEELLRR